MGFLAGIEFRGSSFGGSSEFFSCCFGGGGTSFLGSSISIAKFLRCFLGSSKWSAFGSSGSGGWGGGGGGGGNSGDHHESGEFHF
tara:strand:+ start:185 stop:439 length:255 start_codon:yes stop_codon:yes gene_type:complete